MMKMKLKKNFGLVERTGSTLLEELRFQQKNKKKKKDHYNSVEIVEVNKKRFYRLLRESKD